MQKKNSHRSAFSLIELMIVLTIMGILMFGSYIPYMHHQKKVLLQQAAKELSQSLSEARNLAMYGLDTGSGNLNVSLHLSPDADTIDYYAYPFTQSLTIENLPEIYRFKTKKLPPGTRIEKINNSDTQDFLFSFAAISGSGNLTQNIPILLSYQGSESPVLQKELLYYYLSHISDYN